jgi:preprotein translocase subunit SecB
MTALLLERHFFTRLELRTTSNPKPDGILQTKSNLSIGQAQDNSRRYQLTLTVNLTEDAEHPEKQPTYVGVVQIVGIFRVADAYPDDPIRLVHISGASMLYGAVRELVCNLTARGPYPMVTLATMNFQDTQLNPPVIESKNPETAKTN